MFRGGWTARDTLPTPQGAHHDESLLPRIPSSFVASVLFFANPCTACLPMLFLRYSRVLFERVRPVISYVTAWSPWKNDSISHSIPAMDPNQGNQAPPGGVRGRKSLH